MKHYVNAYWIDLMLLTVVRQGEQTMHTWTLETWNNSFLQTGKSKLRKRQNWTHEKCQAEIFVIITLDALQRPLCVQCSCDLLCWTSALQPLSALVAQVASAAVRVLRTRCLPVGSLCHSNPVKGSAQSIRRSAAFVQRLRAKWAKSRSSYRKANQVERQTLKWKPNRTENWTGWLHGTESFLSSWQYLSW
jgi:hypothetical protein